MKTLFWNVDTQKDFMLPNGKLYIKGAEIIIPELEKLTKLAEKYKIKVVNTGDYHTINSKELSDKPNFKTTFPEHCIAGTEGAGFIDEVNVKNFKDNYYISNWKDKSINLIKIGRARNIIIYKDAFNVFEGNKQTGAILTILEPEIVVVYGVASNVCVDYAVMGIIERGRKVIVVEDAIKELPNSAINDTYVHWISKGAIITTTKDIVDMVTQRE